MIWKSIKDFPGYEVSSDGQVRHGDRILVPRKVAGGKYLAVTLPGQHQEYIHRIVAAAFLGEIPDRWHVNHLDGDTFNNNVLNLQICTPADNAHHHHRPVWYFDQVRIPFTEGAT